MQVNLSCRQRQPHPNRSMGAPLWHIHIQLINRTPIGPIIDIILYQPSLLLVHLPRVQIGQKCFNAHCLLEHYPHYLQKDKLRLKAQFIHHSWVACRLVGKSYRHHHLCHPFLVSSLLLHLDLVNIHHCRIRMCQLQVPCHPHFHLLLLHHFLALPFLLLEPCLLLRSLLWLTCPIIPSQVQWTISLPWK